MIIKIKNLHCKTVIGVYEAEKQREQLLLVHLEIDYNEGNAARSDKIADTLNYHDLTNKVREFVQGNKFELLEKMVEGVGQLVLSYDKVINCHVEIDKPEAPIDGLGIVSVSKTFKRGTGWFPMI